MQATGWRLSRHQRLSEVSATDQGLSVTGGDHSETEDQHQRHDQIGLAFHFQLRVVVTKDESVV